MNCVEKGKITGFPCFPLSGMGVEALTRLLTGDGSYTLVNHHADEPYHSRHGALQESRHVFIKGGAPAWNRQPLRILEVGLGTGLNALLTMQGSVSRQVTVEYHALEPCRLGWEQVRPLNYAELLGSELEPFHRAIIEARPDQLVQLHKCFGFVLLEQTLAGAEVERSFDLIYFDAFAPSVQPELWTINVFQKVAAHMISGGCLVTYCAKGQVRRNMIAAGLEVEKLPGPPGKREMLRAWKR